MANDTAEGRSDSGQKVTDASEERRCRVCQVKLSGYNPGPNCWQHTIGHPWRGPTARPKF